MRRKELLIIGISLWGTTPAQAGWLNWIFNPAIPPEQIQVCDKDLDPVKVNLDINYGTANYDNTLSRDEISEKLTKTQKQEDIHAAGLTESQVNFSISAKTEYRTDGQNACIHLKELDVTVGYDPLTVYIASQYPKESCQYKSVLAHENTHIEIKQKALENYGLLLGQEIHSYAQTINPIRVHSTPDGQHQTERIVTRIRRQIEPLLKEFEDKQTEEHQKLDSTLSYQYTQSQCKTWE